MCQVFKVSTSGYDYWLKNPVSLREQKEQELVEQIKEVYEQSKCRYGSPRISFELEERGIQYACSAFREQLEGMPVQQSMSRKGNCWDNAVAESFFKTMKTEMVYHHQFATRQQARLAIFEYIESFYNRKRRHSRLGYLTPCQYEEILYKQTMAA